MSSRSGVHGGFMPPSTPIDCSLVEIFTFERRAPPIDGSSAEISK